MNFYGFYEIKPVTLHQTNRFKNQVYTRRLVLDQSAVRGVLLLRNFTAVFRFSSLKWSIIRWWW